MNKLDLRTPDFVNENIEKLAALFPHCVTETADGRKIDFDLLQQELSHEIVDGNRERYRLEWPGKREAIVTANLPTTKTLRPVREDSVDFDNTENLYIEGDNLEVLKLLQESYFGKIKMIYIDPPYNTGNDFVYKDNFSMDNGQWSMVNGEKDEYGTRLVANPESSGRYHSDWLTMMYPRLKLARNLLTDDGVIFISIDDNEVHNLRKVCDEVFGEVNFVAGYVWESTFRPDNSSKIYRKNAENIICYSKNIREIDRFIGSKEGSDGLPSLTKNSMKESILFFKQNTVLTYLNDGFYYKGIKNSGYELLDDVTVKGGKIINSFHLKGKMIWGQEYLERELNNGTEIIIKSDGFVPYTKKNTLSILAPNTLIPKDKVGDVLQGRAEFIQLFGIAIFDYPKPTSLLRYLLSYYEDKDSIILDFFSGSATTAHAVMQLNAEDGGNRKYIMVQLPEQTDKNSEAYKAGYKNICEIGKERIRRAGKLIVNGQLSMLNDNNGKLSMLNGQLEKMVNGKLLMVNGKYAFPNGLLIDDTAERLLDEINQLQEKINNLQLTINHCDNGFRVYRLADSNMQDVYYRPQDYKQESLNMFADNIKPDRTPDDLLAQVMLDWGLPLSYRIEQIDINGKQVFRVAQDSLMACFDKGIDEEFAKVVAKDKPLRVVFRDSGFASDTAKINVQQLLKQLSPETEMKVI